MNCWILDFSAPRCFGTFYSNTQPKWNSNSSKLPLLRNKAYFSSSPESSGCRNIVHPNQQHNIIMVLFTWIYALSTIGSYIHLCNWLTLRSGLLSIQFRTKITFFSKQPETMLPCIGLKNHLFIILLISSTLCTCLFTNNMTGALFSQK